MWDVNAMKSGLKDSKMSGLFTIEPNRSISGELTIAGSKTSLYIWDKEIFSTKKITEQGIKGILSDFTKVSLIDCITSSAPGHGIRYQNEQYFFTEIFPRFVVSGDRHLEPKDPSILAIRFVVDDSSTLFSDFDTFGSVIDARKYIDQLIKLEDLDRPIQIGPHPVILYYTGKNKIFNANTVLGRVCATHCPSFGMGTPEGVSFENTIFTSIRFPEPIVFQSAIERVLILLRFFELIVGRPQNLSQISLELVSGDDQSTLLQTYWCIPPFREADKVLEPHFKDTLLDAASEPDALSDVLIRWLDRNKLWRDARFRFSNSFSNQNKYSIDRLIGSANMFDILPNSALPSKIELSDELLEVKKNSRSAFKELPKSPERDSILDALGRLGKSTLKNKIRHRAQVVLERIGERLPDLLKVTDEAVNCRNYYVHGTPGRIDYSGNFRVFVFLTDTLEFVFAVSDLIESGWDIEKWINRVSPISHPFSIYMMNYKGNLMELNKLLGLQF
jgi:hypothetical protein